MRITKPGAVFFAAMALVSLALAPAWVAGLPRLDHGVVTLASFAFFSKLCHQRSDRSLILYGSQAAVCMRCLGLYAGAALGSLVRLKYGIAVRALLLAFALNCLDVAMERLGVHGNLPPIRFLIGAALGIAAGAALSSQYAVVSVEKSRA
jgi:uncharacterized membrane protein